MKKPKILFVVNNFEYVSGVTTYLISLFKYLNNKYELYLVTSPGTAVELPKKYNVKIYLYPKINFELRSYLNFFRSVVFLTKIIILNKIDLIHSNDHYTANIIKWTKYIKNIPNIRTIHSLINNQGRLKHLVGDYFICVNYHIYNKLLKKYWKTLNAQVILNGIDFDDKIKISKKKKKSSEITLLVASRLVFEKGVQTVIRAVSKLPLEYKDKIILKIAGKGNYEDVLIALSKKSDIRIEFLDEVREMDKEYKNADIFIFSSLVDSFGYTNIEAAKYGCFVITSNFEGIEYIFDNNKDGFIYDKNSYIDLQNKIIKAINLGEKRNIYVSNFQKKCITKFNSEQMALKTSIVYEKCLRK